MYPRINTDVSGVLHVPPSGKAIVVLISNDSEALLFSITTYLDTARI